MACFDHDSVINRRGVSGWGGDAYSVVGGNSSAVGQPNIRTVIRAQGSRSHVGDKIGSVKVGHRAICQIGHELEAGKVVHEIAVREARAHIKRVRGITGICPRVDRAIAERVRVRRGCSRLASHSPSHQHLRIN